MRDEDGLQICRMFNTLYVWHPWELWDPPVAPCPKSWFLLPHSSQEPHILPRATHLYLEHGKTDRPYSFLPWPQNTTQKPQELQCLLQKSIFSLLQQVRSYCLVFNFEVLPRWERANIQLCWKLMKTCRMVLMRHTQNHCAWVSRVIHHLNHP